MKKEESKATKIIAMILMILVCDFVFCGMAFLRGKAIRDLLFIFVLTTVGTGSVVFSLIQAGINNRMHYDNAKHYMRFALLFIVSSFAGGGFVLIPYTAWVFPVIALFLALFSEAVTGIVAYEVILGLCVYLAGEKSIIFLIYSIVGIMFVVLFDRLDKDYKIWMPFIISIVLYSLVIIGEVVFKNRGYIDIDNMMIPVINIFVTIILTLCALKYYCSAVIDRERTRYVEINDQEFELLAKYKQKDSELYFNGIHTAYFAEKFARIRNLDVDVVKNGGYYHKIILAECKEENLSLSEVCLKYKFPESAYYLLQEYCYKSENLSNRESVTVYLADAVVSGLMYILEKEENKNKKIDYGQVAAALVKRKVTSGILNNSDFTCQDVAEMEKMLIGEKLYYDFLRRE